MYAQAKRSGRIYKDLHSAASMSETGDHSGGASPVRELPSESTTDSMAQMLQFLLDDRRRREEQIADERRHREDEQRREHERREAENARRERDTQRQIDLFKGLIDGIHKHGESAEKEQRKTKMLDLPN